MQIVALGVVGLLLGVTTPLYVIDDSSPQSYPRTWKTYLLGEVTDGIDLRIDVATNSCRGRMRGRSRLGDDLLRRERGI
ncbi:MAG: hypothetical protein ACYCST_04865 [Acidimicrobiales bacterium]